MGNRNLFMRSMHLWCAWLLPCLIILGCGLAAAAERDWLTGQSCAVRCAGYLEQRLLNSPPSLEQLRGALGTEHEAASLEQLQNYLEGVGLHTMPCEWTGKAVACWEDNLYLLIHLSSVENGQGHFMVVEKNDEGITVVDWPRKQSFSNSSGGIRRWREYVTYGNMTPIGLLVDTHPITLPEENVTSPMYYVLLSCGVMTALLFSLLFDFRYTPAKNTSTPCR